AFYRNKLEYTFSKNGWLTNEQIQSGAEFNRNVLGFHMPGRFDKILDIENCYLQPEPSNSIRLAARDFARTLELPFYDAVKQEGFWRNLIIRTANTGELMVILLVKSDVQEAILGMLDHLYAQFP